MVVTNIVEKKKKVTFNENVKIHPVPLTDECREKYWEIVALDAERFKRNITAKSPALSRILQKDHRSIMLEYIQEQWERSKRFKETVEKMTPILNNIIILRKNHYYSPQFC